MIVKAESFDSALKQELREKGGNLSYSRLSTFIGVKKNGIIGMRKLPTAPNAMV